MKKRGAVRSAAAPAVEQDEDQYLTYQEAAEELETTLQKVRQFVGAGELSVYRSRLDRRKKLIPRSEIAVVTG